MMFCSINFIIVIRKFGTVCSQNNIILSKSRYKIYTFYITVTKKNLLNFFEGIARGWIYSNVPANEPP